MFWQGCKLMVAKPLEWKKALNQSFHIWDGNFQYNSTNLVGFCGSVLQEMEKPRQVYGGGQGLGESKAYGKDFWDQIPMETDRNWKWVKWTTWGHVMQGNPGQTRVHALLLHPSQQLRVHECEFSVVNPSDFSTDAWTWDFHAKIIHVKCWNN